ncbi:HDOD domain-containing protein [Desulfopila sp. IMCC35006]|uniref:HDOD domain-containing protein n=1 Tax=Desulfopila sp. IMCC35006 TaxID=2569542 RepID=UPI0010AD0771|nr:HDOD domain-containing protein [Desulfopila sp. IMCC35006]TKB24870.1 HDOD domain-containing protein [Desulfopila sp. IMCC35006]
MTHPDLAAIDSQINSLPALPTIVTQVIEVTADPESSASDLMQVILPDQTMCSTILKVANSAFFGIPRGVSTIDRAVVVLGHEEIKNIVIGKAIFSSFPTLSSDNKNTISLFWEHAFTCGLAAKIIGEQLRLPASELFIAGLIHDIGKLAMLMAFPNKYPILREICNPSNTNDSLEEQAQFAISHDKVGLQLARKWLLPEQLVMAIGYHHRPQDAPSYKKHPLIVQMADILSLMYCHSDEMERGDVEKIIADFLPETSMMWTANALTWNTENFGLWYEMLQQQREKNQEVLGAFSS